MAQWFPQYEIAVVQDAAIQPNLRVAADGRTRPLFEDGHVATWASETFLVRPLIDLKVSETQGAAVPQGKRRLVVAATVWLGVPSAPKAPWQVVYRGVGQAAVDGAYNPEQARIVASNMRFGQMADGSLEQGVRAALIVAMTARVR